MSETTKLQQYKYSLRTIAIAPKTMPNGYFCGQKFYAFPVPPDNAISIENLYLHLIMQFKVGVASGDRRITKIGIASDRPSYGFIPSRLRTYDVNLSADPTTRIIDTRIDLSALLKKDNVRWRDFYTTPATTDQTYVYIELATENSSNGDLILCKMDCLYTTTGIR